MTDEAKAIAGRLRQVTSVLFDDYGDGTHAVEDYALAGKAADLIETQAREIERLRYHLSGALDTLLDAEVCSADCAHCNDARATLAGDSYDQ